VHFRQRGKSSAVVESEPQAIILNANADGTVNNVSENVTVKMRVGGEAVLAALTEIVSVETPSGVAFQRVTSETTPSGDAITIPAGLTKLYSVGLISDPHYNSSGDDTEFLTDIENAMDKFDSMGVDFVCCGR